jgi:hypothetical protein
MWLCVPICYIAPSTIYKYAMHASEWLMHVQIRKLVNNSIGYIFSIYASVEIFLERTAPLQAYSLG